MIISYYDIAALLDSAEEEKDGLWLKSLVNMILE